MALTYTEVGDYRIPDLTPPESPKVGKYGLLRRTFLREHRGGIYTGMLFGETLNAHLEEIDRQANEMMNRLVEEMKPRFGVTEALKASNQMDWVARMNAVRSAAEETVLNDLIYA